ncbi:gfo/Idh/MocA family oxidoreductase [Streptomyces sp. AcE210]|uniref:Gfo/Idh/MocA family protein n=1 Tax=Streptomyces sp. AcE210 TaxID=2292703 RepID=UPI000E2FFF1E|nr:gfo/Idh/MocA family oxidoreductase [Streptomyces sp. AcE210]RFC70668.1 gfo/Idh/MocA family oxidoreductase [Streptomyces sp. AcE210]
MTPGSPERPLRFGLIGVDSPHAPSFTRLFGDGVTGTVPGGTVVAAWKGVAARDFPLSRDRIDSFAQEVSDLGVPLYAAPEDVAERCDALLVVASDARTHAGYFKRLARFAKPVYVDTRFALTTRDARDMLMAASACGCLPLAGSPKRFTPEFRKAVGSDRIDRIELTGPLPTQPGHPVLDWYGVHLVDLAVALLGPGCVSIDAPPAGRATLTWADGRIVTLGGEEEWSPLTTGRVSGPAGDRRFTIEAGPPMLTGLLTSIVDACRHGVPNVPEAEVLEIVAIVEAARRSRAAGAAATPAG